jgi:SAM-dependent methyltransferase
VATEVLNLGAGNKIVPGAVNHDLRRHRPEIDVAWDLNDLPWPWEDNSFDKVLGRAVFEHLRINLVETIDECWRILRPGGQLFVKLPHWQHEHAYLDPTHYWRFTLNTLNLFVPSTRYGRSYGFYTDRKWRYVKPPRLNRARSSFAATMEVIKT